MKKCLSIIILSVLIAGMSFTHSMAADEPVETVIKYFEASKSGDVEAIKTLIAGPFYKKKIVLLEKNTEYPEFLKEFFEGSSMQVINFESGDESMVKSNYISLYNRYHASQETYLDNSNNGLNNFSVVIAMIYFKDGSEAKYEYLLKQDTNDFWKIYEDILSNGQSDSAE